MDDNNQTPHIIVVLTPGIGHLIPLIQFAKRLLNHHKFSFTFIIPTTGPPTAAVKSALAALPTPISYKFLPPINFDDLPADTRAETKISLTVTRSLPALRQNVEELSKTKRVVSFVVDLFGTDAFDVAFEFKIKPYIFYPSTAMCLSLCLLYLPHLDETVTGEYCDVDEPYTIPGCVPVDGHDMWSAMEDRKNEGYQWALHHSKRYWEPEGIMVNTFEGLESGAIKALQEPIEEGKRKPPVYPIGPIIQTTDGIVADERPNITNKSSSSSKCLEWLDNQPDRSVLYVSFGSGGTLSQFQLNELALGLEMSQQRFLWVVRCPNDEYAGAAYFTSGEAMVLVNNKHPLISFLPNGFLERTKERGLIILDWAPQVEILSHRSTGGFLSHCGWNSTLETVVHGVPIIAWPLYAEQKMNAVMLSKDLKVALRPSGGKYGATIGRDEIANVVKDLMMEGEEGKKVRDRMTELKNAAANAVGEKGASTKALSELASKWRSMEK